MGHENGTNLVIDMIHNYCCISQWMLNVINEWHMQGSHVDDETLFWTTKKKLDIFGHFVLKKLDEYCHNHVDANCKDALN